jgi:hypothetical protein
VYNTYNKSLLTAAETVLLLQYRQLLSAVDQFRAPNKLFSVEIISENSCIRAYAYYRLITASIPPHRRPPPEGT